MKYDKLKKNSGSYNYFDYEVSSKKYFKQASMILDAANRWETKIVKSLSVKDRKIFRRVIHCLENGVTGVRRRAIKNHHRFCQFYHIRMNIPYKIKSYNFPQAKIIKKWEKSISKLFENIFPNFTIGLYVKYHIKNKDSDSPYIHFHITLSKILLNNIDRERIDEFNDLSLNKQFECIPYFLVNKIDFKDNELEKLIEKEWRKTLRSELKMSIPRNEPSLVHLSTKQRQNKNDRSRSANYDTSNARRTFKHKKILRISDNGSVSIAHLDEENHIVGNPYRIHIMDFIKEDLIAPNKNPRVRCCPRGFFHSKSKFKNIIEVATKCPQSNDNFSSIMNLPINDIVTLASEFRNKHQDIPFTEIPF